MSEEKMTLGEKAVVVLLIICTIPILAVFIPYMLVKYLITSPVERRRYKRTGCTQKYSWEIMKSLRFDVEMQLRAAGYRSLAEGGEYEMVDDDFFTYFAVGDDTAIAVCDHGYDFFEENGVLCVSYDGDEAETVVSKLVEFKSRTGREAIICHDGEDVPGGEGFILKSDEIVPYLKRKT